MANEATMSIEQAERVDHQLVRGIGIPALTANIISSTIGAGIFVLPAAMSRALGPAAPVAFVCCAIAMVLFVTCFAIAGSRVQQSAILDYSLPGPSTWSSDTGSTLAPLTRTEH